MIPPTQGHRRRGGREGLRQVEARDRGAVSGMGTFCANLGYMILDPRCGGELEASKARAPSLSIQFTTIFTSQASQLGTVNFAV